MSWWRKIFPERIYWDEWTQLTKQEFYKFLIFFKLSKYLNKEKDEDEEYKERGYNITYNIQIKVDSLPFGKLKINIRYIKVFVFEHNEPIHSEIRVIDDTIDL